MKIVRLILLLAGTALMALAVNLFLVPAQLAEGGVTGVAIILLRLLHVPLWVTVMGLNLPILALGVRMRGWGLLWRSLLGTGAFSGWLAITGYLHWAPHDRTLSIVYGGLAMGIGLGVVLYSGATTGGTDILALILHQKFGLSVGQWILAIDALVITAAGIAFHSAETSMYSAITLAISSKVVDLVQEGFYAAKGLTIITADPQAVARTIMERVGRGCTLLPGTGAYTGQPRGVIYTVVQRSELAAVKQIVTELDPAAFVAVSDVHEVLGDFELGLKSGSV